MFWSSSYFQSAPKLDAESLRRQRINCSRLYLPDVSSKAPVIYSSYYNISFLGIEKLHPFDSSKWGRVCQFLIKNGCLEKSSIVDPSEASREDLLVVHTEAYLNSLTNSVNVARIAEIPPIAMLPNCFLQMKVLYPFRKQVGGTVLAAKLAKERGWAINIGGGFHHCSSDRGGGFCAYADISLCIHFAFVRLNISRVMIIDLDAHQGNGHEMDFGNDERVYIMDMYNPEIYPFDMTARNCIKQKVEVRTGTKTDEYLKELDKALSVARSSFVPELIVYNAGTDILDGDPLGGLKFDCFTNSDDHSSTSGWIFTLGGDAISWRSKHNGLRHSYVKNLIQDGVITVDFVRSSPKLGDPLTKGLARDLVHKTTKGVDLEFIRITNDGTST